MSVARRGVKRATLEVWCGGDATGDRGFYWLFW